MPIYHDKGESEVTKIKQAHFRSILSVHLGIVSRIFAKHQNKSWFDAKYYYFDINAGDGRTEDGGIGSARIFLEEAQRMQMPYHAVFIERNAENVATLAREVMATPQIEILHGDHSEVLPLYFQRMKKPVYGLLYADPNGCFDVDILRDFSQQREFQKVDILINCNGTAIKRTRKSTLCEDHRTLQERLAEIQKRYWIVREPYGKFQWSFLIGTQWDQFPEFRSRGFFKMESERGRAIFEKINLTHDELAQHRQPAFRSTYNTYAEYLKTPEVKTLRRQKFAQTGGICEVCKSQKVSEIHHVKYPPWGEFDTLENLLAVCHACHCKLHNKPEEAPELWNTVK